MKRLGTTPAKIAVILTVIALTAFGFIVARTDIVMLAVPLALWLVLNQRRAGELAVDLRSSVDAKDPSAPDLDLRATAEADMVQIHVRALGVNTEVITRPGELVRVERPIFHSGPQALAFVAARSISADGTEVSAGTQPTVMSWNVEPATAPLDTLPVRWRLLGLHGTHHGQKQGDGGEFRDLHAFVPGDQLRRVDWRATARTARRPGDLMVRRMNTLSEANIVIAIDNVQDLGTAVRLWGLDEEVASGVTSMDYAREASLSIATKAIATGDRVSYLELAPGGRLVRSGSGKRHLDRVRAAVASTASKTSRFAVRRSPQIPSGSVIYLVAAFVGADACDLALSWQATGHRVIAVDVMPQLDASHLTDPQHLALRIVHAERSVSFRSLRGAGIEVITWPNESARLQSLALATRVRGR